MIRTKIALIGDGGVGKTALRSQFMGDGFDGKYIMTIGADFAVKVIKVGDDPQIEISFQIWDLAGQPRFHAVRDIYYRGSAGALFVFDVTRIDSYNNSQHWFNEIWKRCGKVPIIILGNKSDLRGKEGMTTVDPSAGDKLAEYITNEVNLKDFSSTYLETSARTGQNVEKAFALLGEALLKKLL